MERIGPDGPAVFPLALSGNRFGWTSDENVAVKILDEYVAAGGNFIDTADGYSAWAPGNLGGESESIIGRWVAARRNRDRVVLATKVGTHPRHPGLAPSGIRAAADASLARLQTDRIDIYHAHSDDPRVPIEEIAAAFDALVKAGKVRLVGASQFRAERIREWIRVARDNGFTAPTVMQPRYSLVRRDADEQDLVDLAADEKLAVVPYFTSSSGFLLGHYRPAPAADVVPRPPRAGAYFSHNGLWAFDTLETIAMARGVRPATVALAWVKTRPGVVAPIISPRTPEHLAGLVEAISFRLEDKERAALDEISTQVLD
ncbi:aldo/keto reductase [Actinoplanes sp. NPDC049596]|uniref:aldo/keto reductase n=1 Tax=unclassified Actinoplanes TaxID=2626549 RepID=UPI00341968AC